MADTGPLSPQPDQDDEDRRPGAWSTRWRLPVLALVLLVVASAVGVGAYALGGGDDGPPREVLVEAADTVGPDPFSTAGIVLTSGPAKPGLFGGSGDNGRCDADAIVAFLTSEPAKAGAWVKALNSDPTLTWSGGQDVQVADIGAYVAELRPAVLVVDTRVINHGFRDGVATPRQALLRAGTAVLVDRVGKPRVRCFCGNPLIPQGGGGGTSPEPSPNASPSPEASAEPSAEPSPNGCIENLPETDGCGPEPTTVVCNPVPDIPAGATDMTTAPVDVSGDGAPDLMRVYQIAGVWHVRAEVGGTAVADEVLTGPGPSMTAIGGAEVDGAQPEELWVKVGSGSATDIIGLLVFRDCSLQRIQLGGVPAEFPVGVTATAADGVACFGFDTGIEVFTTTSSDGVTYTGSSNLYTIDQGSSPLSLVLGSTAAQSQTTADGPSWDQLHTFNCDSLNTIP